MTKCDEALSDSLKGVNLVSDGALRCAFGNAILLPIFWFGCRLVLKFTVSAVLANLATPRWV